MFKLVGELIENISVGVFESQNKRVLKQASKLCLERSILAGRVIIRERENIVVLLIFEKHLVMEEKTLYHYFVNPYNRTTRGVF